jgi:hypothetical protein
MKDAISDNVDRWDYDPESEDLLILFLSGGLYVYHGVGPDLADYFNYPHPWRQIGREVKEHRWDRLN